MARQLDPSDEELLQAALSSSFTRLPPRTPESKTNSEPPSPSTAPSVQPGPQQAAASTSAASESVEDSFKEEYDRRLAAWRAEAEIARAKAERTRAEWEVRRKAEEEEEERQRAAAEESRRKEQRESTLTSWETVSPADDSKPVLGASVGGAGMSNERVPTQRASVQTFGVDAQMPPAGGVSGLGSTKPPAARAEQVTPPGLDSEIYTSEEDERRSSRHWEEVPSLASSFPSLPDHILSSPSSQNDKVSPKTAAKSIRKHGEKSGKHHEEEHEHHHRSHSHHHHHDHGDTTVVSSRGPPPSVTLSVFRPGLSPRARALAIASSIAINFVLPFINGVMLGFGEIFAKNFVAPLLGIKPPSVANVGVRTPTTRDRRR